MSLAASITSNFQTPTLEVYINGRRVQATSATTDAGYDSVSAAASIVLPSVPAWLRLRQPVEVRMGYDGRTQTVFVGELEDDGRAYDSGGFALTVKAAGRLKRTQYQYHGDLTYVSQTDQAIVNDLLDKTGITAGQRDVDGAGELMGVAKSVVLDAGQAPWTLINDLDQVLGYKTFDGPEGVVRRRRISGIPGAAAYRTFTQGSHIFSVSRPRTLRGIHNAVMVSGLPQVSVTPFSSRTADNPLVPTPPQYVAYDFRSDLIETNALATTVATRLMTEVNRVLEEVELECPGDPRLVPGMTIGVTSSQIGLSSATNFWCRHVTHQCDAGGYVTRLTLEGGVGEAGQETDLDPEATFSYRITRETWLVSGTPTDFYTVTCDGAGSYDLDGTIATYAWSNNKNADTGTASTYATSFTQAQIDATAQITLTVTDNNGNTNAITQTITSTAQQILVRDLYVAAGSRAEATSTGGKTWNTWTPAAGSVVSTPTIAGETHSYFGLSDGKLYRTNDYLATAPTLVKDFGSQVECIWINEADANRVTVGLANGQVHRTLNADQLGSSAWTQLVDLGTDPVRDIVESALDFGQYRVCVGSTVKITYDDFASTSTLITFDGTAYQIIPSLVGLPGLAAGADTTGNQPIQSEDGTAYTFPVLTPETDEARAATHHIRQASILYVDRAGRSFTTADGGTAFSQKGTLGAGDPANRAIRDGDNQLIHYVAADDGLWKSYDGAASWKQLRDYAAVGLVGWAVGYGGIRPLAITSLTVVSTVGTERVKSLWSGSANIAAPDGWRNVAYNDSAWGLAVAATTHASYVTVPGSAAIWATALPASATEHLLTRRTFTLSAGLVTSATLTISADDDLEGVWLNNAFLGAEHSLSGDNTLTITVDPALLLPGASNVLAVYVRNELAPNAALSYKLEIV